MNVRKGYGIIAVSIAAWEEIGKPRTYDAWRKALLLPDTYEVHFTPVVQMTTPTFEVWVSSAAIPMNDLKSEVIPFYQTTNGKSTLTKITIRQWDGNAWKTVATEEIK